MFFFSQHRAEIVRKGYSRGLHMLNTFKRKSNWITVSLSDTLCKKAVTSIPKLNLHSRFKGGSSSETLWVECRQFPEFFSIVDKEKRPDMDKSRLSLAKLSTLKLSDVFKMNKWEVLGPAIPVYLTNTFLLHILSSTAEMSCDYFIPL